MKITAEETALDRSLKWTPILYGATGVLSLATAFFVGLNVAQHSYGLLALSAPIALISGAAAARGFYSLGYAWAVSKELGEFRAAREQMRAVSGRRVL